MTGLGTRTGALCALLAGVGTGCIIDPRPPSTTSGGRVCSPPCPVNSSCNFDGTCSCLHGYAVCPDDDSGSVCTDTSTDASNCGGCGHVCGPLMECVLAECSCIPSLTIAQCDIDGGLVCVDLTKQDPNEGGGCGIQSSHCGECGGEDSGSCCSGHCSNTSDPFNCGGCGNVCPSGECFLGDAGVGVCNCQPPYAWCGPLCVDPYTDFDHCGGDCTACSAPATQCIQGHCR